MDKYLESAKVACLVVWFFDVSVNKLVLFRYFSGFLFSSSGISSR